MAANTDKFKKARRKFATTVGVGGCSAGATTIPLSDVTGLDTTTAVVVVIDAHDANGNATPALEEVVVGVISGNNLIGCVRGKEGTVAQAHSQGANVNMYFTETHWDDLIDGLLVEHHQDGTHANTTSILQTVYPVGSIYMSTVATNPATLFGFGTWSAYAAGRVIVGKNTSGTFQTAGATGGEETHTLSWGEMPVHYHGVNDPGHGHSLAQSGIGFGAGSSGQGYGRADQNSPASFWSSFTFNSSGTGVSIQNAGSGQAHNNLQPYIVTYIWQRTA